MLTGPEHWEMYSFILIDFFSDFERAVDTNVSRLQFGFNEIINVN